MLHLPDLFDVVATDNYGRDYISEIRVAENLDKAAAETLAASLNNQPDQSYWHVVRPAGRPIWGGMDEFV